MSDRDTPRHGRELPPDSSFAFSSPEGPAQPLPEIPDVKLHGEIARGGMGVVYRGRQDFLDRDVAVKLLSSHLQGDQFAPRFRREAKLLAGIKHPHIVGCHTAGTTSTGQSYLVMEFIDGPNLKAWIAENGALPLPAALRLARQLASALGHASELGVIHRDVKPENILLESPTSTSVDLAFPYVSKLVDLGLARMNHEVGDLGLTAPGSVMGTPVAMAPEQFDAPDSVDFRADIYGLGCVLYEMLTGVPAFESTRLTDVVIEKRRSRGPNPCDRCDDVPTAVGQLVATMLACDPAGRPASYRNLVDRLDELSAELPAGVSAAVARRPLPTPSVPAGSGSSSSGSSGGSSSSSSSSSSSNSGGQLLQTAEFEFLAEGGRVGAGSGDEQVAFPDPTGVHAGVTSDRRSDEPSAAVSAPRRRGRRRLRIVIIAIAFLFAGVTILKRSRRNQTAHPSQPPAPSSPGVQQPSSRVVSIRGLDGTVRPDVAIKLSAHAPQLDGETLRYQWTARPGDAANLSRPVAPTTNLRLEGLPGDKFTIGLEVRGPGEPIRAVRNLVLDYEPTDLFADFLTKDTSWSSPGRFRTGKWTRRAKDGAVSVAARGFPCFRTRGIPDSVWRVTGQLLPDRQSGRSFAQTAVCLRIGATRLLAILCERDGAEGEQWSASMQTATRQGRGGFTFRPLTSKPKAVMALDKGGKFTGANYSITRRGSELVFTFGFPETGEVVEHRERVRSSMSAMLILFANGGRGVFPKLELW